MGSVIGADGLQEEFGNGMVTLVVDEVDNEYYTMFISGRSWYLFSVP